MNLNIQGSGGPPPPDRPGAGPRGARADPGGGLLRVGEARELRHRGLAPPPRGPLRAPENHAAGERLRRRRAPAAPGGGGLPDYYYYYNYYYYYYY